MIISKAPMRISLFGGSTDYKSFYEKYGSILIGTTINKYAYSIIRYRPSIVSKDYLLTYSQVEHTNDINEIRNPLIRETLKYYKVWNPVELNLATDMPWRTGLGGSSSCCVSLASAACVLKEIPTDKRQICDDAIKIEREILNEAGGIQDQIWACYGGFNMITIPKDGKFVVKPMPVSPLFKKEFENSLMLIYSKKQRTLNAVSESHQDKDKRMILSIARRALDEFINENIESIGKLLYESWKEKKALSNLISDLHIDCMVDDIMKKGAFGVKLLGSGAGGFILVVCDKKTKKKLKTKYGENVIDFEFETDGLINSKI